jgi:DNA invertase Pin-like site-specific DNA recombinase
MTEQETTVRSTARDKRRALLREDAAIRRRLRSNYGDVRTTAADLGLSPQRVRQALPREFQNGGPGGRGLDWPEQTKLEVRVLLEQNAGNVKRTARECGVPVATVRRWRDKWREQAS